MSQRDDYSDAIQHPSEHEDFQVGARASNGEPIRWAPKREARSEWVSFKKEFSFSNEEPYPEAYSRFLSMLGEDYEGPTPAMKAGNADMGDHDVNKEMASDYSTCPVEDLGPNTRDIEAVIEWVTSEIEVPLTPKSYENGSMAVTDTCEECGGGGLIHSDDPDTWDSRECEACSGTGEVLTWTYTRSYGPLADEDDFTPGVRYALRLGFRLAADEKGRITGRLAARMLDAASSKTGDGQDLQALVDEVLELYALRVQNQADADEDVDVEASVEQMDAKVRKKMVDAGV
jgi:hypothetical protein